MKTKKLKKTGRNRGLLKMTGAMIISIFTLSNGWATHPDLDTADVWVEVNNGFAKCAPIGESAGEAFCSQDQFRVVDMIHRQGSMYAYVKYVSSDDSENEPSNTAECSRGLFRHDTITNKWVRVANMTYESGYDRFQLRTNGEDIFAIQQGVVYKLVEDSFTVEWAHGADSTVLFDLEPGTYDVTVTDDHGCTTHDSYEITEPDTAIWVTASYSDPSTSGIQDGNITLTVGGGTTPYSYEWFTSEGDGLETNQKDQDSLSGGIYELTITDDQVVLQINHGNSMSPALYV